MIATSVAKHAHNQVPDSLANGQFRRLRLAVYTVRWLIVILKMLHGIFLSRQAVVIPYQLINTLALGNPRARAILEKLCKAYPVTCANALDHFRKLEISGYRIVHLYKASKSNIHLFSFVSQDLYSLICYLQLAEDQKLTTHRDGAGGTGGPLSPAPEQILDLNDIPGIRAKVKWSHLLRTLHIDSYLEEAVYSFLLPDKINCAQWYINYMALRDESLFKKLLDEVTPYLLTRPQRKAPFFPAWFIAGYPQIVQWALLPSEDCSLFDMLADVEGQLDWYQLRKIYNEYHDSRKARNFRPFREWPATKEAAA